MKKCEFWQPFDKPYGPGYTGACFATKYMDCCKCNGNELKCDFYLEKKEKNKTMKFIEMWSKAQENNKTYLLMNEKVKIFYRKDKGFFDSEGWSVSLDRFSNIDSLMNTKWQETTPVLTKSEAEAKFNIKIVGD